MKIVNVLTITGLILASVAPCWANPIGGLEAYWSFDNVADPVHDDSGNGHNGTVYGPTSVDGICGKALGFDGQNDYVNFGNAIGNFGTSDFSIVLWLRTNTDGDETVMGKRVFCGEHSFWELNMSEGPAQPGCMLVELYESYPSIHGSFPGNQRLDDNQWHLLAITRQGVEAKLYIDGFVDASRSAAKVIDMSNSAPFLMGRGPCIPVHADYFSGDLDEVRIYNRALSDSEMEELFSECDTELVEINIDPDTLNLKSKGKWITCYIELPEGYDVADIDVSTIMLNEQVSAELQPSEIGDYDDDGIADLMVKFNRAAVQEILEAGDEVEITVTGELTDGTPFEGTDTIRVIDKGGKS